MAERSYAYEPKQGSEGLVIESFVSIRELVDDETGETYTDRRPGEAFTAGGEDKPWPYATTHPGEQAILDGHPLIKRVAVQEAESAEPKAQAKLDEKRKKEASSTGGEE
jgi:hypothetical protein